jgi:hypothetical protein
VPRQDYVTACLIVETVHTSSVVKLCGVSVEMRGDARGSAVTATQPCPSSGVISYFCSYFSKNEISVILFFAAITICSVILENIYYINNVKCWSYRCCLSSICTNDLGWVHIYCNSALYRNFTDYPWGKHYFVLVWLVAVIFVKWQLSSKRLFVRECWEQLSVYLQSVVGRQHFGNRESIRMIAAYVCRTDSNISTTCFKMSGRRGEFVLTAYHLTWDNV